jgi:single-stranded DNA-binding protein
MSGSIFVTVVNGTVVREPMFYENEKSNALHWTLFVEDLTTMRSKKTYIDIVAFGWLADNKRSDINAGDKITVSGKLESFKSKNSETFKMRVVARDIVISQDGGLTPLTCDVKTEAVVETADNDERVPF